MSSLSIVKKPRTPGEASLNPSLAMSIPASLEVRIVGSVSFKSGRNGRMTSVDKTRRKAGVLTRRARESLKLPGLMATAVMCANSECCRSGQIEWERTGVLHLQPRDGDSEHRST